MKNIIFSIIFIFTVSIANNAYSIGNYPKSKAKVSMNKKASKKRNNKKTVKAANSQRTKCNSRAGAKKKAYYNSIQYR